MCQWTNVYMILDVGSNPYFGSLAKYVKVDLEAQRDLQFDFTSVNSVSGINYTATLQRLKQSSRGKLVSWNVASTYESIQIVSPSGACSLTTIIKTCDDQEEADVPVFITFVNPGKPQGVCSK
ncbi:hypothetical protein RvY_01885-2 [Ramazzottius varieornatus]|uniref:Uncharacterized protein n=1 Tax=Ramazzottius varieornatus TaxID=947166 RepID=A0A1D1ULP8_RAMVA|nr:hypothetical protein RvY_01885-2 [Ramazzottius varieornatus]